MPLISMAQQQTYVPDDNFEAALETMGIGNGIPNDNYVTTSNIDIVTDLQIGGLFIDDLTGIEDFTSLEHLNASHNNLKSLDLSNNLLLNYIILDYNPLSCLNIANGNNLNSITGMSREDCSMIGVPYLNCVTVDSNVNVPAQVIMWLDSHVQLAGPCPPCNITINDVSEVNQYRKLVRIIDLFGRDVIATNEAVFFIYDDGSVERKVIIQ
tara:strand:+ start:358 stop:990 length:633 start_codon:yes stop_codon:yes gene_type:complete